MIIEKPSSSKRMQDGVYLGKLESVREVTSKLGTKQFELELTLNTKERTLVWVNQSTKGLDLLYRAGVAEDRADGRVEIRENNTLCGVVVSNSKAMIIPATTVVSMNPALLPLFGQTKNKYHYK